MRLKFALLGAVIVTAASIPAHADDLFTLTNSTDTLTFSLPASPTPPLTSSSCDPTYTDSFCFTGIPVDINGATFDLSILFYGSADGGGLVITPGGLPNTINQYGLQLYTGSLTSPTFTPGYYPLTDGGGPEEFSGNYDLTISATPEPSSLVLLGTGLLGLAGAARRKLFAR